MKTAPLLFNALTLQILGDLDETEWFEFYSHYVNTLVASQTKHGAQRVPAAPRNMVSIVIQMQGVKSFCSTSRGSSFRSWWDVTCFIPADAAYSSLFSFGSVLMVCLLFLLFARRQFVASGSATRDVHVFNSIMEESQLSSTAKHLPVMPTGHLHVRV